MLTTSRYYAKRPCVLLALMLTAGCDHLQMGALKAYMAVNTYEVEDGAAAVGNQRQPFVFKALVDDLDSPWGFDFLPSGEILITQRPGGLWLFDPATATKEPVSGLPEVHHKGQGGLLDVLVHPDFQQNRWLYLSAAVRTDAELTTTRVWRFTLAGDTLTEQQLIFEAIPAAKANVHYGSALLMDDARHLFITMGDRRNRHLAQDLGTSLGKTLRYTDTGEIPADNPFLKNDKALPEIYSYGHRNPQGITRDPASGRIWIAEHGPQGGDEVNLLKAGANYGWPVITYGEEYGGGAIGEGTQKPGMQQPLHYYVPSIGTAGVAYYNGAALPGWQGDLLVAGLRSFSLSRLHFSGDEFEEDERLLESQRFRLRNLKQGPDELLYLLTENGGLLQVAPDSQVTISEKNTL